MIDPDLHNGDGGKSVGALVDQDMPSGTYTMNGDCDGCSSGVLKAGNTEIAKKMTRKK